MSDPSKHKHDSDGIDELNPAIIYAMLAIVLAIIVVIVVYVQVG